MCCPSRSEAALLTDNHYMAVQVQATGIQVQMPKVQPAVLRPDLLQDAWGALHGALLQVEPTKFCRGVCHHLQRQNTCLRRKA